MTIQRQTIHVVPNKTLENLNSSLGRGSLRMNPSTGTEKALWRPVWSHFPGFLFALPCPRHTTNDYRTFFHQPVSHWEWLQSGLLQQCSVVCKYIQNNMEAAQSGVQRSFQAGKGKRRTSQSSSVLCFFLAPRFLQELILRLLELFFCNFILIFPQLLTGHYRTLKSLFISLRSFEIIH